MTLSQHVVQGLSRGPLIPGSSPVPSCIGQAQQDYLPDQAGLCLLQTPLGPGNEGHLSLFLCKGVWSSAGAASQPGPIHAINRRLIRNGLWY